MFLYSLVDFLRLFSGVLYPIIYLQLVIIRYTIKSKLVYTNIIYIALSYRHTLYIKVAHTNYLANSLNIYTGETLVPSSGTLSSYLSINKKPYYSSSLFLNKSIDLTSISL